MATPGWDSRRATYHMFSSGTSRPCLTLRGALPSMAAIPDQSQWVPTGSVIAAIRNGEFIEQLKSQTHKWNQGEGHEESDSRGYAKGKQGDLIQIGTIPVPHSKDKPSPRERQDKRDLVRRGATIFKKEMIR